MFDKSGKDGKGSRKSYIYGGKQGFSNRFSAGFKYVFRSEKKSGFFQNLGFVDMLNLALLVASMVPVSLT